MSPLLIIPVDFVLRAEPSIHPENIYSSERKKTKWLIPEALPELPWQVIAFPVSIKDVGSFYSAVTFDLFILEQNVQEGAVENKPS